MGLPGHRRTSGDKRRNSANKALKEATFHACPKCKKPVRPHRVCAFCGTYKGKAVLNVQKRTNRTARKHKAK
ncbi:MAG TPA: 50S ribosomal protein L32 [Candidatus Udaeobacter sp.]|nr:50S ribosomal protein L32 [Candidatus Udaeobacter sp.]